MDTQICKYCSRPIPPGSSFCAFCGKSQVAPPQQAGAQQVPQQPQAYGQPQQGYAAQPYIPTNQQPKAPKQGGKWWIALIAVAGVAILTLVLLFVTGVFSPKATPESDPMLQFTTPPTLETSGFAQPTSPTETQPAAVPAETAPQEPEQPEEEPPAETEPLPAEVPFRVGIVLVGDENDAYTLSFINGILEAADKLGLSLADDIIWKYNIAEDESAKLAIEDCIANGCSLIFANSYGHQDYAKLAAEQNPGVQIVALTGDTARASGLSNFHNAFPEIYEARYAAGVVAGMKIAQLDEDGKLTEKNYAVDGTVKVGYVGAYPYAEVVSGYTAFYLGVKSVYSNVSMQVQYINSWSSAELEKAAAEYLIGDGCVIIGQYNDTAGAPTACEEALSAGTTVYSVAYNTDRRAAAPHAVLTSPAMQWGAYFTYAIGAALRGEEIATNWAEGFDRDAVALTSLGTNVAPGTQEKVNEVIAALKTGTLHPFDTSTWTVNGEHLTVAYATDTDGDWVYDADNAIFDGYYHESWFQSAPSFYLRIDGIIELN